MDAIQSTGMKNAQLARVAAAHGMTVPEWELEAARLEAAEREHKSTDRLMRQIPKYRAVA